MHRLSGGAVAAAAALVAFGPASALADGSFIGNFSTVSEVASTVPRDGDVNPYGLFVVPRSHGDLVAGDALVSNFNNSANEQGTGTTIVEITPSGAFHQFARIDAHGGAARCPGGIGLTTALVVLQSGWVIVGSLPTTDGTSATAQSGCLLVLNDRGAVVETIAGGGINGPWDMTVSDEGSSALLFVTNVLNGTVAASPNTVDDGTVLRIGLATKRATPPTVTSITEIGDGFPERTDVNALVVGPTGVGLSPDGTTLYVADSVDSQIETIADPLSRSTSTGGTVLASTPNNLNDPLGLTMAPNGDVLTVDGGDGNLIETTPSGMEFAPKTLDSSGSPPGAGALFGVAVAPGGSGVLFVDDATNQLNLLS